MIPTRRALLPPLAVLVVAAACDTTPGYLKGEARRQHLSALGVERFDSAQAYRLAGVSAVRTVKVQAMKPGELGADTLDAAFGLFSIRCGACHDRPSPGSKPAYMWEAVLSRMKKDAQDAGLMPMSTDDEAQVLRFLQQHAADSS